MVTLKDVLAVWEEIKHDEENIMFIVGAPGSGKSKILRALSEDEGWQYIEAKELLSEVIFEVPREGRPARVEEILDEEIKRYGADVVILDSIDILFAPILNLDPVAILKRISKNSSLVVGWKGSVEGDTLYLEHNNDPKYYKQPITNHKRVIVVD